MVKTLKRLTPFVIALAVGVSLSGCTEPGLAGPFPYRKGQGPIPPGYETGVRQEAVITMTSGAHKGDAINVTYDVINYYPSMRMAHKFTFKNGMTLTVNLATQQAFVLYPHGKKVHSIPYNELPRHQNGEPDIEKILQGLLGGEVTLLREAHPPLMVYPKTDFEIAASAKQPGQAVPPFQLQGLPVDAASIDYINWYGNTEFAYQKRTTIYSALQGLHSGIDFMAPSGTPVKSIVNRSGVIVSINNEPHKYKTGPGNLLIDYGGFLILYGHTQRSNRPEKVKLGAEINQNDTIAYVGADEDGLIHLHLEVIRKNPPGSGRPGDIRTNPVLFFSPTALAQLKQKAKGIGATFHPIPGESKWQTPENQPDVTPGSHLLVP